MLAAVSLAGWAGPWVSAAWGLDFTALLGTRNKVWGSTKQGVVNETHLQARCPRAIFSVKRLRRIKNKHQNPTLCSDGWPRSSLPQPGVRVGHRLLWEFVTRDLASRGLGFKFTPRSFPVGSGDSESKN